MKIQTNLPSCSFCILFQLLAHFFILSQLLPHYLNFLLSHVMAHFLQCQCHETCLIPVVFCLFSVVCGLGKKISNNINAFKRKKKSYQSKTRFDWSRNNNNSNNNNSFTILKNGFWIFDARDWRILLHSGNQGKLRQKWVIFRCCCCCSCICCCCCCCWCCCCCCYCCCCSSSSSRCCCSMSCAIVLVWFILVCCCCRRHSCCLVCCSLKMYVLIFVNNF